jgi:hypothetical protein
VTVKIEKKGRPVKGRVITYLPARLISFVEQEAGRLEVSKSRVVERIIERAQGTQEEEADTEIYNFTPMEKVLFSRLQRNLSVSKYLWK